MGQTPCWQDMRPNQTTPAAALKLPPYSCWVVQCTISTPLLNVFSLITNHRFVSALSRVILIVQSANFEFCMLLNCCILLTDFRTVFVFALGPFLPMSVVFFDFNGNFNGKMARILFLAIKSSSSVLQTSSYHC